MSTGATWEVWAWMAGAAVVNVLWQGALVGGLGILALTAMRKASAQARYGLACLTLAAMAALLPLNLIGMDAPPLAILQKPKAPLPYMLPPLPVESAQSAALDEPQPPRVMSVSSDAGATSTLPTTALSPDALEPLAARSERPRRGTITWYDHALPWVGKAWWTGVLALLLYDLMGLWAIRHLRNHSTAAPASILSAADNIREQIGVRAQVSIRIADGISTALVTGFFRVVILLPASMATGMAPEHVEAILAHELAHVRRWDRWFNLLQRLIEAVLFFHPLVWWLSRIAQTERELCCDEIALQFCPDRPSYVRALLDLSQRDASPALALSSHGGGLALRVRYILNAGTAARHGGRPVAILLGSTLVAVFCMIALYAPVGNAASLPERVLRFPDQQSVGTLYGRWIGQDYRTLPWMPDHNEGWTMLALARGDVKIPADTLVKLSVAGPDLNFLRTLQPDDVYFLDASFKGLSDAQLAPIAHLSGLRALDLSDNADSMAGTVFENFGVMSELEWLDLERTVVDATPDGALAKFTHLRYLAGHFRVQTNNALRAAASMPELEFFSLKSGQVSADALKSINHHGALRGLALDNVGLNDEILAGLDDLPGLIYLDLRKNPITDTAIGHVAQYPGLRSLNLDRTAITDLGIELLYGNVLLEHLYISNTKVTEDCLDVLGTLPSLTLVSLFTTSVDEVTAGGFMTGLLTRSEALSRPQQSSNPDAPKVGLVFSHATATSPHISTQTMGFTLQNSLELARAMDEANFDVYAVLEPGSEIFGELPWLLQSLGLVDKCINGYDAVALASLDALFAATLYDVPIPMLDAIAEAVEAGTGFVNVGALGVAAPGERHPAVVRLTGIGESVLYWQQPRDAICPAVQRHPILGPLGPGDAFVVSRLDGCNSDNGALDGTILLDAPAEHPGLFPVLYTRSLDQGRIVRAQWHRPFHTGIPFPGFSFYVRAINWAAHRDADAVW